MGRSDYNKRELRWNALSEDTSDIPVHHWTFLVVNESREIEIIKQRIKETIAPTSQGDTVLKGPVPNSGGLHYAVFTIDSYQNEKPTDVNLNKIYRGTRKRDEKLGHHRTSDGLEKYVPGLFS